MPEAGFVVRICNPGGQDLGFSEKSVVSSSIWGLGVGKIVGKPRAWGEECRPSSDGRLCVPS